MSIRDLTRIGVFSALTVVLAQIVIPLPFTPVPLTLSLAAVFLTGILLPPKSAFYAQAVYLALGAVGLPVFHGFTGGFSRLIGPTGGYLTAYPIMALIVACFVRLSDKRPGRKAAGRLAFVFGGHLIALISCYFLGTLWLSFVSRVTFVQALAMAVYPFIALDLIKIFVCVLCVYPLRGRINAVYN
ncbi:MAG: biotin transporter BioY [Oscillospiraceae bacterium]|jgi:biotin transport system substrate-specific component|nr:biotin transporter BioY [Oscillospiraceae bacterium]